jgi:hypothetical protein
VGSAHEVDELVAPDTGLVQLLEPAVVLTRRSGRAISSPRKEVIDIG